MTSALSVIKGVKELLKQTEALGAHSEALERIEKKLDLMDSRLLKMEKSFIEAKFQMYLEERRK